MGNLVEHAKTELALIRGKDSEPDEMQDLVDKCVTDIVTIFEDQGHSGSSASYVLGILKKVMAFEPVTPLTGADDEWFTHDYGDGPYYQNKRCSHVFKDADGAYDIEGIIFRDPDGSCFTNRDSRVNVTFPYTPSREYRDRPAA